MIIDSDADAKGDPAADTPAEEQHDAGSTEDLDDIGPETPEEEVSESAYTTDGSGTPESES